MFYLKSFENHSGYAQAESGLTLPNVSLCETENEVHYKIDPFNGHEYVDLGLPSGTLWAKCNVGAQSETDYGLYFAWAETQGYTADQVTGSTTPHKSFIWEDYKYWISDNGVTKYTEPGDELTIFDDAAAANMKGEWHIPTNAQLSELRTNTNASWTSVNGIYGYRFTSKTNGNSIFIPTAGYCSNNSVSSRGTVNSVGNVWTSTLGAANATYANALYFEYDRGVSVRGNNRCIGLPVRGVIG